MKNTSNMSIKSQSLSEKPSTTPAKSGQTAQKPRTKRIEQGSLTRARILQSALKHFSQNGFAGASVRDISADAGVTHAVIRLHFRTKENLWKAAIDELFAFQASNLSLLNDVNHEEITAESLAALIRQYVRHCASHPDYMRIMIHETIRDSDRLRWVVEKHLAPVHLRVKALFQEAVTRGIIPDAPIESLMYIWISSSQMIFALRSEALLIHGVNVLQADFVERHADAIVTTLLGKRP